MEKELNWASEPQYWASLGQMLEEAQQEIAAEFGKPDWTYRDLPLMTPKCAEDLFAVIGEGNYFKLTWAEYSRGDEIAVRGQILISPKGMENLTVYNRKEASNE